LRDTRGRSTDSGSNARSRSRLNSWIGAKHTNAGAEFGSTERDHVLSDVLRNNLAMLRVGVRQDVLNEVVSILVAGYVDQWNTRSVKTTLTNTVKIAAKEVDTSNFETLLDNLGSELIHAILGSVTNDMINGSTTICRSSMFADMLDAPVTELSMSNNVSARKDLFNAWTLPRILVN
jgi:hypothetical protein